MDQPQNEASPASQPVTNQVVTNMNQTAAVNPGKGLAIAGIVLAFFFQLIGLILSIIAYNKSKKANSSTTLATVGIILNSVFTLLILILVPILIAMSMTAYSGIQSRARTSAGNTAALSVLKKAEAYNALNATYPKRVADFNATTNGGVTNIDGLGVHLATSPLTEDTSNDPQMIELSECNGIGNKIGYWDYTTSSVEYLYTPDVSRSADCRIIY